MIKGIAVGFLDDDLRLHSGEVRNLLDEFWIAAGENARQSRFHGRSRAGGNQRGIVFGKLQHFSNSLAGGNFQLQDPDKVPARLCHDRFKLRADHRSTQHGHGSFAVDDSGHTQLLVGIAGVAKTTDFHLGLRGKKFARRGQ